jgi:hypothetical protein
MDWINIEVEEPEVGQVIFVRMGIHEVQVTYLGERRIDYPNAGVVEIDHREYVVEQWKPIE